jgi:hypothetical protein
MSQVGFEPTISVFERAKMIHVSDRVATVIGTSYTYNACIREDEETVNGI